MKIFKGQGTADLGKPWRFEEDGLTVTRGCAWSPPGCHPTGCGIKTYVNSNGELVRVEGDENHPITNGRLCVRCLTIRDYVYNPDRVLYPMKRAREDRGKNKWERITWDEAYDTIAEKVKYFKDKYGAESILVMGGTGREGGPMLPAYAHACLGTPNACYTQSGYSCYIPRVAGTTYVMGATYPEMDYAGGLPGRYDDPMFKLPELIVFWGKEPLPSNGDGLFGHAAIDMMRRGSKLMSIDPRVNWVSTRADWHLRLRPGTDAALGMAMLNVIIEEDLYDHDFVDKWCYGFEQLAERVKEMPAEKAAEICDLDANQIREAARVYAAAKPAQIAWGLAIDQKSNGVQAGHCIMALEAITGNIDVPGGQLIGDVNDGLELGFGWNNLGPELQSKILGIKEYPAYVGLVLNAQCDMVLDALEAGDDAKYYPFKMGVFEDTNFLAGTCAAQPKRWHDAMVKNLEWCFGIDVWMTPTIQATCEIFLPLSSTVEHDTVVYTHYGASPIMAGAVNKSITVGDCKGDCEIFYELGLRCMPINFEKYKDYYDFLADYRSGGPSACVDRLLRGSGREVRRDGFLHRPARHDAGLARARCRVPARGLCDGEGGGTMTQDHGPDGRNWNKSEVEYDLGVAGPGQSIVITITRSVGVKIMDHKNYELYKADEDCRAFSGQLTSSPYRFKVPREARWHVIINPHTYSGTAEFNVKLIDDAVLGA